MLEEEEEISKELFYHIDIIKNYSSSIKDFDAAIIYTELCNIAEHYITSNMFDCAEEILSLILDNIETDNGRV